MKKMIIAMAFVLGAVITLSVLLYPVVAGYVNSRSQSRVVTRYFDDVTAIDDSERLAALEAARAYNRALLETANRFRPTEEDTAAYQTLLNAGRGIMGILAIDKIDVNLPIYHGTDEGVLQVGIGHLQGTSLPVGGTGTHVFISGHRGLPSSKLLSNLDRMEEGDCFVLYVMGETLTYQVDQIRTVEPDEVNALQIDRRMDYCTLVTCTPYGINTHRLLVRGHRMDNSTSGQWSLVYADAKRLDKLLVVLLFLLPVVPVILLCAALQCAIIHKKGKMKR